MRFSETKIPGAFVIDPERRYDERGFFARTWCAEEFDKRNLVARIDQCSISFNERKGTLRGIHYQIPPFAETKLVRCTGGAIYDVLLDLRPESPTFKCWFAVELSAENRRMLYIPEGIAHGFQTLVENTEVFYQISAPYHAESVRGVRWDDKAFNIYWPEDNRTISTRDMAFPDFVA